MYMSDTFILANSIWPNGMKVDSDGHAVFYPLGTNKVEIPTSESEWPKGDKLISPFVYDKDDKLVGFIDTKALTVSGSGTTTMNYSHIEADFASIYEGTLTVNAPNATVKKFRWAVSPSGGDDTFDFVIIDFTTTDQETIDTVRTAKRVVDNKLYDVDGGLIGTIDTSKIEVGGINDDELEIYDGLFSNMDADWNERGLILSEFNSDLSSLTNGSNMFQCCYNLNTFSSNLSSLTVGDFMFCECSNLTSFSSDLSSLTDGSGMFDLCENLISFSSDLPSLTVGDFMFNECTSFTSFSSDLSSLTYGHGMFCGCENLTSFTSNLSSLIEGDDMFAGCSALTSFSSNLSSLTDGGSMFSHCDSLTSFNSDLSSLTNGKSMFYECSNLESFSSDLPSLTIGQGMFRNCPFTIFSSDLPSLTNGNNMFYECSNLESFSSDLSSLTNGNLMFPYCSNLTSFSSDLSSLQDGQGMFQDCSNLTSFSSDLPSLTAGGSMFDGCKLNALSVKNIIDTINTIDAQSQSLTLGLGCDTTADDRKLFAQEAGYNDMTSLLSALEAKGWGMNTQYNGRPTTTYGLRRPSEDTLPVFVKLEEVEEVEKPADYTPMNETKKRRLNRERKTETSTEDHANYTSLDDSKKFRLTWFHETTGSTDGYTQFNSLEEAIESLNIKPIERN